MWSLIIPSRDGEDTLPACLASVSALASANPGLEVILVDNGSTDGTAGIMREFASATGAVCLTEPRSGKSFALNTALERARGDVLLFLDDDVIADANLVNAYATALHEFPGARVFAGQVRPSWQAPPPGWLAALADEGMSCGCTTVGMAAGWISPGKVKGANMCFPRKAIGGSRFDQQRVNFGSGSRKGGGLDTEFARRVGGLDGVRYVPDARVLHLVNAEEMKWRTAFSRYLRIGRNNAAQGNARSSVPLLARAAAHGLLALSALAVGAKTTAARNGLKAAMQLGELDFRFR